MGIRAEVYGLRSSLSLFKVRGSKFRGLGCRVIGW